MTSSTQQSTRRSPFQWLALAIGVVYLLIAIGGFAVTGFDGFTEHDHDQTLLGFAVNPLHNLLHGLVGVAGLALWARPRGARVFGWLLVIGYGGLFFYGLSVVDNPAVNVMNINWADNWLHLASALAGVVIVFWPERPDAPIRHNRR